MAHLVGDKPRPKKKAVVKRTPVARQPSPPTQGVLQKTQSGGYIRLAGPPKPHRYGNVVVQQRVQYVPGVYRDNPKRASGRVTPQIQQAILAPTGSPKRAVVTNPVMNPSGLVIDQYKGLPKEWRSAFMIRDGINELNRQIRQQEHQANPVTEFFGNTIHETANWALHTIQGFPGGIYHQATTTVPALFKSGLIPGFQRVPASPSEQVDAIKTVADETVVQPTKYYAGVAKDAWTRPMWTLEHRLGDLGLTAAAAWSGAGGVVRGLARAGVTAADIAESAAQAGSIRGGVRVARGRAKARARQQVREIAPADVARPSGAPSQIRAERQYRYTPAEEALAQAQRGAEVTGNYVGNSVTRSLRKFGDFTSKSSLPGSSRYRHDRVISAPTHDRHGRPIGEVDAQGNPVNYEPDVVVPRRPYSPNPLSRVVQKQVGKLNEKVGRPVAIVADAARNKFPKLNIVVPSRADRVRRKTARNMTYEIPENSDAAVAAHGMALAKLVGKLKASGTKNGMPESEAAQGVAAASIRAMGAAEDLGGSRVWGRDVLLQRAKNTLYNAAPASRKERMALEQQIRTLESIPDHWLDPATAPRHINDLTAEAKKVLDASTDIKQSLGVITPRAALWGRRRTQAQFLGARPLARVKAETYAPIRRDAQEIGAIRQELKYRETAGREGKSHGERFTNYTTEALQTRQAALIRRNKTLIGRVQPYVKRAEENALRPYANVAAAEREVIRAQLELKRLSQRASREPLDREIAAATEDLKAALADHRYATQRAAAREKMARQGASAMEGAAARRARLREAAARYEVRTNGGSRASVIEPAVRESGYFRGRFGHGNAASRTAKRELAATRGEARGVPLVARPAYQRVMQLRGQRRGMANERVGSPRQIAAARTELSGALNRRNRAKFNATKTAYHNYDLPQRAGMAEGSYFPHRSITPQAASQWAEGGSGDFRGAGAGMRAAGEKFNAGIISERGDMDLSVRPMIDALRSAVDARERTRTAAAVLEKFTVRDINGRAIEGEAAKRFVDASGGLYELVSGRKMADVIATSADTAAGMELRKLLDESLKGADADKQYAIPKSVMKGWNDVLAPAHGLGKLVDNINGLWKSGVLALSPRWYFQNFFGMWGQFIMGAGADLQAISMARNPAYAETLPGRISQNGLAAYLGEYARHSGGNTSNALGRLVRGGFSMNSMLERVPREAMFWASAKRSLAENQKISRFVMDDAHMAQAWLDVAQAPEKYGRIAAQAERAAAATTDPAKKARLLESARVARENAKGAEGIIDDTINVTERFMGNYSRYNSLEKNILKRVFPFYGWMRAIHRLAFALPFKHPKRAALMAAASQMAYEMYDMGRNDMTDPRSGLFIGNTMIGMSTLNPFMSVAPTVETVKDLGTNLADASGNPLVSVPEALGKSVVDAFQQAAMQAGPLYSDQYQAIAGRSMGGVPQMFSPGYDGWMRDYRGQYFRFDRNGNIEYGTPALGPEQIVEQSIPLVNQFREVLGGGKPYADASLLTDLIPYAAKRAFGQTDPMERAALIRPKAQLPAITEPKWYSPLTNTFFGVPIYDVNPTAATLQQIQNYKRLLSGFKSTNNQIMRSAYGG